MSDMTRLNERLIKAADIERMRSTELEDAALTFTESRLTHTDNVTTALRLAAGKYTDARHHRKRCEAAIVKAEAKRLTS